MAELDDVPLGERRAFDADAVDERSIRRSRVLEHPTVVAAQEARVRRGHGACRETHHEARDAAGDLPRCGALASPPDDHFVDAGESVAGTAGHGPVALEDDEEVRVHGHEPGAMRSNGIFECICIGFHHRRAVRT